MAYARKLKAFFLNDSAVTAIEYALIAAFVFLVLVSAVPFFTQNLQSLYETITTAILGEG